MHPVAESVRLIGRQNLVGLEPLVPRVGLKSIGVSLAYDYAYVTPLGMLMGLGGSPTMHMTDRTVMALNPD